MADLSWPSARPRAVRDAGKRIPEDISLIGFDGLPVCRYYEPRLSTVTQQIAFMAEKSYAVLLDMIENGSGAQHGPRAVHARKDGQHP